jgi:hypothetical protein
LVKSFESVHLIDLTSFEASITEKLKAILFNKLSDNCNRKKRDIALHYQSLINCIELNETRRFDGQNVAINQYDTSCANIGSIDKFVRNEIERWRFWETIKGASGALFGGAVAGNFFGLIGGLISAAAIATYMYLQNPTDDDFKLKESHVESMLNKNLSSVLPDFFNNEEENLTEIMFENVKEFVIELNNDYSNNWYHRYDILKQELNENEERMQLLDEEIADLKSCVEELEECRSFVQN